METGRRSRYTRGWLALALALGLVMASVGSAAAHSVREPFEFEFAMEFPAGAPCDFVYYEELTVSGWDQVFLDSAGNVDRVITHVFATVLHRNVATGYTLTEDNRLIIHWDEATQQERTVGISWHLKEQSGRSTVVRAGLVLVDHTDGTTVRMTPNAGGDFGETLCPALGGASG